MILRYFLICVFLTLNCGPQQIRNENNSQVSSSPFSWTLSSGGIDALEFSSYFNDIYRNENSSIKPNRFNYIPPKSLIDHPTLLPLKNLKQVSKMYKKVRIEEIVNESNALQKRLLTEKPDYSLSSETPTFVFINGLASEFVETLPFAELFEIKNSELAEKWATIVEQLRPMDHVFDLTLNAEQNIPLKELVEVRSLVQNNHTLFNFIYLKPIYRSMESIGTIAHSAQIYQRRIDKILPLLGITDNVYLFGHSRGTAIALEMLSNAKDDPAKNPWFNATRGLISLSGVIFGSEMVDSLLHDEKKPTYNQLHAIEVFLDEAHILDGDMGQKAKIFAHNLKLIGDLGLSFGAMSLKGYDPEIMKALTQTTPHQLKELFKVIIGPFLKWNQSPGQFYNENLLKLKIFLQGIYEGLNELSSQSRITWWERHSIPGGDFLYYAIPTSMNPNDLSEDLYHQDTLDFKALKLGYLAFRKDFGFDLNDSQLPMHRTIFWPHVIHQLNMRSPLIKTKTLSVLANHHWGVTMQTVQETRAKTKNPFPRLAFLKALAYKIRADMPTP